MPLGYSNRGASQASVDDIAAGVVRIEADTTQLQTDLAAVALDTDKIDSAASDGLEGVEDSVAYRIHELERHFHSFERWFGAAVAPVGETHVADRIGTTVTAFQADGGNNTWGSWLQILGSGDTPAIVDTVSFDGHRWLITAVERANAVHFVQVAAGPSGAAALTAGIYSEFVVKPITTNARSFPGAIQSRRIPVGTKVWVRIWAVGQNTGTLGFYFGLHSYEG